MFDSSDLGSWDVEKTTADSSGRQVRFANNEGRELTPLTPDADHPPPPDDLRDEADEAGRIQEDGAAVAAAAVAAGGLGVLGCVRDTRRLVSAHRACDTLSAGKYRLT